MPYLMIIGFDNSSRLAKRVYYFKYKETRFKLIQTERKWTDVLLSIIDNDRDQTAQERVFANAAEFLTALSWENNSLVKFKYQGGRGLKEGLTLRQAQNSIRSFPETPFIGFTVGYNLTTIPKIETNEQRVALTLYREAKSSNNVYLSFLFYWQVLEVGKGDAVGWVNKSYVKRRPEFFSEFDLKQVA